MTSEIRSKGFYWINRRPQGLEVAEWDGRYWQITGVGHNEWDGFVLEVDAQVPPPHICNKIQEIVEFYAGKLNGSIDNSKTTSCGRKI